MIILFAFVPVNEFQRKVTNEDGKKLLFTGNIPRGAFVSEGHRKSETYCANLCDQHKFCASRSVLLRTEWTVTVKTSLIISPSSGITSHPLGNIRYPIAFIPLCPPCHCFYKFRFFTQFFEESSDKFPFSSLPWSSVAPGQLGPSFSFVFPIPLPPEVAKGIIVLPEKS